MLKNFNLILSTYRRRENDCLSELWYFSEKVFGVKVIRAAKTGLPGLLVALVDSDPLDFVEKLRNTIVNNPYDIRFILKVVPIQKVTKSDINVIKSTVLQLVEKNLSPGESYKIDPVIRLSTLTRKEVIEEIAPEIKNPVNLENPDKIVRIEVIGERTGVSVIPPSAIISLMKLRRRI